MLAVGVVATVVLWVVEVVGAVEEAPLVVVTSIVVDVLVVVDEVTAVTAVVGTTVVGPAVGAWFGAQATRISNAATGKRSIRNNLRCLS